MINLFKKIRFLRESKMEKLFPQVPYFFHATHAAFCQPPCNLIAPIFASQTSHDPTPFPLLCPPK